MPEPLPPEWVDPPDLATAKAAQIALAARVVTEDAHGPVRLLGGVDISNTRFDPENLIFAAVVVLSWPGLRVVASASAVRRDKRRRETQQRQGATSTCCPRDAVRKFPLHYF